MDQCAAWQLIPQYRARLHVEHLPNLCPDVLWHLEHTVEEGENFTRFFGVHMDSTNPPVGLTFLWVILGDWGPNFLGGFTFRDIRGGGGEEGKIW